MSIQRPGPPGSYKESSPARQEPVNDAWFAAWLDGGSAVDDRIDRKCLHNMVYIRRPQSLPNETETC